MHQQALALDVERDNRVTKINGCCCVPQKVRLTFTSSTGFHDIFEVDGVVMR